MRLLEETPREKVLEAFAARIEKGTSYREVVAALLLAGVRNIQPRPSVGFKFHAVLVVNSAHLASISSPDEHRWLPIFWALDQFKSFTQPSSPKQSKEDSKVPKQVCARKLFTPAGFRSALKVLQKEAPGRITNFSMRPDRIDLQVVRNGKTSVIDFPSDAEVPQVLSTSTGWSPTDTFGYEELNPGAPARLMRAANARLNQSPADVDYFVAQKWTDSMQWGVYYKGDHPIGSA